MALLYNKLFRSSDDGRIVISVQDDGPGIPDASSWKDLTGFGLQLVCALAEQLNAAVRLESGQGKRLMLESPE